MDRKQLKIYRVMSTGIHVGYLTIDDETTWGKYAIDAINSLAGAVWVEPVLPSGEWVTCSGCIYWDECEEKENVDGCEFGETEGELNEAVD